MQYIELERDVACRRRRPWLARRITSSEDRLASHRPAGVLHHLQMRAIYSKHAIKSWNITSRTPQDYCVTENIDYGIADLKLAEPHDAGILSVRFRGS